MAFTADGRAAIECAANAPLRSRARKGCIEVRVELMEPRFEGHAVSALASLTTLVPVVHTIAELTLFGLRSEEVARLA